MDNKNFCHECGAPIETGERFCHECGAEQPVEGKPGDESPIIGAGARANITGGVNRTTNTTTNVNTSKVDNSSTVNHNTTYVMNGKKSEYCEVCGNPLEEKHPRCPKCGKEICNDCKVASKNRCIECEKKAINEYRIAYQQLLLTTNGNIGIPGRQMMNEKARELDVEDSKEKIEKDLEEIYKPANKAVQPDVRPTVTTAPFITRDNTVQKSVNTMQAKDTKQSGQNGSSLKWIIPVAVLAGIIAVLALLWSGGNDNNNPTTTDEMATVQPEPETPVSTGGTVSTITTQQPVISKPEEEKPQDKAPEQVETKSDANYEAGMKAYNAGEGLEAIGYFESSGSADAYYMLGLIYKNGCGNVGKNDMKAKTYFKKADKLGCAKAKAHL